jgi:hypothetical protein
MTTTVMELSPNKKRKTSRDTNAEKRIRGELRSCSCYGPQHRLTHYSSTEWRALPPANRLDARSAPSIQHACTFVSPIRRKRRRGPPQRVQEKRVAIGRRQLGGATRNARSLHAGHARHDRRSRSRHCANIKMLNQSEQDAAPPRNRSR